MSKRRSRPNPAKLKELVDEFNAKFPVGTRVLLRKDTGEVETSVRAKAEVLNGHSAVAWFVGTLGAYSIEDDRVRPVPTATSFA